MHENTRGVVMKQTIATSALVFMLSVTSCLADYTLLCRRDLGGPDREYVVVKSTPTSPVDTLQDACAVLSSDPLYADYQRPTCLDTKSGGGTCADPR
jgi:hypothetical protein